MMPGDPIDVSVVIPVHARPAELGACLAALAEQTFAGCWEILVCDDGSPESDSERIVQLASQWPRVRYLRQDQKGPAAARNLGIRAASGAIVAFTDSDTLPRPEWLAALHAPFVEPEIIAVEGPVRPPRPAKSPLEEAPRNEGGARLTANIAYRRSVLLQVGGLDEQYPLAAFEDVELALAAQPLGRFTFAPGALVLHPWRRVGLWASLRRLRQMDWLLATAQRYGCLGWIDRPTRFPRARLAWAAAVTLPIGRARKGLAFLRRAPADAMIRVGIAAIEAAIGILLVPRWFLLPSPPARGRYLESAA